MNTTTTPQQQVIELLDQTIEHVGFSGYLLNEDFTTFKEVRDLLEDNGAFNVEVIYYNEAMSYLMDHDNSLKNSLELAIEYGYSIKDLNSELLASLLASENARTEFYQLESEINSILN
jgi:hypothetical protein